MKVATTAANHDEYADGHRTDSAIHGKAWVWRRPRRGGRRETRPAVPVMTHVLFALFCCSLMYPSNAEGTWWERFVVGEQREDGKPSEGNLEVLGATVAPTAPDTFVPTASTLAPTILIFSEEPSVQPDKITNLSGDLLPTVMEKLGTAGPTEEPTPKPPPPTSLPTLQPTPQASAAPSASPSNSPSSFPSQSPTSSPSTPPTDRPSTAPSSQPTPVTTTLNPSDVPTPDPTLEPTDEPVDKPSQKPTPGPTEEPTNQPVQQPSVTPFGSPSTTPSQAPLATPSETPSAAPFGTPSATPSDTPSAIPTETPSNPPSAIPSLVPTGTPSQTPTTMQSRADGRAPVSDIEPTQGLAPTEEAETESPTPATSAEPTREKKKNKNKNDPVVSPTPEPTKEKNKNKDKKEDTDAPSPEPTKEKNKNKNKEDTDAPSPKPTKEKNKNSDKTEDSIAPSPEPTKEKKKNKNKDTDAPSFTPSAPPSAEPTKEKKKNRNKDTESPSPDPTNDDEDTQAPTNAPNQIIGQPPSLLRATPSSRPSSTPSAMPSGPPSISAASPSSTPTSSPSLASSSSPTASPFSFTQVPLFTEVYTLSVSMTLGFLKTMSDGSVLVWQGITNVHIRDYILDTNLVTDPTVWTRLRTQNETIVNERFLLKSDTTKSRNLQSEKSVLSVSFDIFIQFKTSIPNINVGDFINGAFAAEPAANYVAALQGADSMLFSELETVAIDRLTMEGPFATSKPSPQPSAKPEIPISPTNKPSTIAPSTNVPTTVPPTLAAPTTAPSRIPSQVPSQAPSQAPSGTPSIGPDAVPSAKPSFRLNVAPSAKPSMAPNVVPSAMPSNGPSAAPSAVPSHVPSVHPSPSPSVLPSVVPSNQSSSLPTSAPSFSLQVSPSSGPVESPTLSPTPPPTSTASPTAFPTEELEVVEQLYGATATMTMVGINEMSLNDVVVWGPLTNKHMLDYAQAAYGNELDALRIKTEFGNQTNVLARRDLQSEEEFEFWFYVNVTFTAARRNLNVTDFIVGGLSSEEGVSKYIDLLQQNSNITFWPLSDVGIKVLEVENLKDQDNAGNNGGGEGDKNGNDEDDGDVVGGDRGGGGDPNGQQEAPAPSSSNNTWIYVVAAVGGVCLIALIFLFGYLRQSSSSVPSNGGASQTAASKTVDDRVTAVVDVRRDDVSTLSDPNLFPGSASFAGGKMSLTEAPSVAGSADYDYAVAYGDPSDFSSVSTSDHQSKLGGMSFVSEQISQSEFTGGGFSTYGKTVGSSTLLSDDASFREQYVMEGTEQRVEVVAPRGLLGIVIDTPRGSIPTVYAIKETSILADQVRVGDKLISVDGEDTTALSAAKILQMLSERSENEKRVLVFMRPNAGDNASQYT